MSADLTAYNDALKEWYSVKRIQNTVYQDNPLFALMPKSTKFPGKNMPVPIIFGNPTTTSADFTTAQNASLVASSNTTKVDRFDVTRVKRYGFANVDGETMRASESDEGAFLKALKTEMDGALHQLKRNLAVQMYRQGWGAIGVIGSASTTTLTLATTEDITNVEVGQQHVFGATEGSGTLRGSGTALTVTGVNRGTGVITYSANVSSITSATTGDTVFLKGDRTDATTPTRQCIAGLEAWVPNTAPTSTAFFSVDRTQDVTRLAGQRLTATGVPIEEALIEGAVLVGREGFKLTHYFMPYSKWSSLQKAMMGKVQYAEVKATGDIAFQAIVVNGPRGPIKCIADQNCPGNRIFGLNLDYWKLQSAGEAIAPIEDDGNLLLRRQDADTVEARFGFYGNLWTSCPAASVNIAV